ncbi:SDR family NAD(P)-dependent oxidoreductase [Pseudomonas fluorescens]|uniref:SDR family NAD(P)-dependent oxidoreductase n=1 Tax=Pseudomonas fluorescens TaxID=294 RepID=UPI000F83E0A8
MCLALCTIRERAPPATHVLNISSVDGLAGFAGTSIYCASKVAVTEFSTPFALEFAPFGNK